ncbi:MAG TPA: beta-eliminating lyase-related protein, partial [Acidimicrobiia bacterium]|nr:beta-eliminating lyase-related protein [Acidimicrobiia bacterium]
GGVPGAARRVEAVVAAARRHGLAVHCDGARLFNAAVALGTDAAALAAPVDTVMFCLSKGLSAPVGSMLAGTGDLIAEARLERARLGGGMRQAGVIAAAGIVALTEMVDRLAEDHARARRLAEALAERFPGSVDPARVVTNIVWAAAPALPASFLDDLADEGVRAGTIDPMTVRLVTHKDVDDADLDRALAAIAKAGA